MKRLLVIGLTTLYTAAFAPGCASSEFGDCKRQACGFKQDASKKISHYGDKMELAADETVCIEDVLEDPKAFDGKLIRVCGRVDSVCAHKGCWMKLSGAPNRDTVFVKFTCPVEGRLIPMEAVGHQAVVEGTFTASEISEADARHYAEDAGKSGEEIAKIVGPQPQLRMKAPVAKIRGI